MTHTEHKTHSRSCGEDSFPTFSVLSFLVLAQRRRRNEFHFSHLPDSVFTDARGPLKTKEKVCTTTYMHKYTYKNPLLIFFNLLALLFANQLVSLALCDLYPSTCKTKTESTPAGCQTAAKAFFYCQNICHTVFFFFSVTMTKI